MASSIGRLALGIIGSLVLPGFPAIGFALGSAIGGAIFTNHDNTEGARLNDTAISVSSLGKTIPEQYGVTRSAGNVIWSAGLKEVATTERQGGKGGGPKHTEYTYYASFATVFGQGEAQSVRRIWADGKLIYDPTDDEVEDKYTFRFMAGGPNQGVDALISESINRRLAGMDDVSKGNQEPIEYTSIDDLIETADLGRGQRSPLYANLLRARKAQAEAGVPENGVPDYRFTPAYKNLVYIVFDDIALEDFGNRIPNITAEIVWEGAMVGWGEGDGAPVEQTIQSQPVPEISPMAVPNGLEALDYQNKKLIAASGSMLRRFGLESRAEEGRASFAFSAQMLRYLGAAVGDAGDGGHIPYRDYTGAVAENIRVVANGGSAGSVVVGDFVHPNVSGGRQPFMSLVSDVAMRPTTVSLLTTAVDYATYVANPRMGSGMFGAVGTSGGGAFVTVSERTMRAYDTALNTNPLGVPLDVLPMFTPSITLPNQTPDTGSPRALPQAGPVVLASSPDEQSGTYAGARVVAARYGSGAVYLKRAVVGFSTATGRDSEGTPPIALSAEGEGYAHHDGPNITHIVGIVSDVNRGRIYVLAALADDTMKVWAFNNNLSVIHVTEVPYQAPAENCGLTGYRSSPSMVAFGSGRSIVVVNLMGGGYRVYEDVILGAFDREAQSYVHPIGALFAWQNGVPYLFYLESAEGLGEMGADVRDVIRSICLRAGMLPNEFSVDEVPSRRLRGYTISRTSDARRALEPITRAFFVEAVESGGLVRFRGQSTEPVRRIHERELGSVSSSTGPVNWMETRRPEFDLPAQINLNYSDQARDYQTASVNQRRISQPIRSMHSQTIESAEFPLVMREEEATVLAERLLYTSWMERDYSKATLNWTHVDLDPGDIIEVEFDDGRIVTDRISSAELGANFEYEVNTVRAGDPVSVPSSVAVIPSATVPSVSITTPVASRMFAFDIPLLYDYHSTGGAAVRFYTAVGADTPRWRAAAVYGSWDNATYTLADTIALDVSWGQCADALPAPRAPWITDTENSLQITVVNDKGNIASVTREDILNGANRALIWNPDSQIGEVIQFQDVEMSEGGTVFTLTNLQRGLRGTEYAVGKHEPGAYFFLISDSTFNDGQMELSRLNSTTYFKAVSAGQLVSAAAPVAMPVVGRALMPWAPAAVRRQAGVGEVTISWNRRTRIGGQWNTATGIETVPLNEDYEAYELYLLADFEGTFDPNDPSQYHERRTLTSPSTTFTEAELAEYGIALTDGIKVAVYQISGQVGRGFGAVGTLAP